MSNRITAWFELPLDINYSEDFLYDMLSKVYPKFVKVCDNGYKCLENCSFCSYFDVDGMPGYAGVFIWSSSIIYEQSNDLMDLRKFLKSIVGVFGAKEVWYTTEHGVDVIQDYVEEYGFDYDWKSFVRENSEELKVLYEDDKGDFKLFHHDDFEDIDKYVNIKKTRE